MRWVALLVVACGCDRALGLRAAALADARYYDAPPDAPWACPSTGAPAYGSDYHFVEFKCTSYTIAIGPKLASAMCQGQPSVGPVDTQMLSAIVVTSPSPVVDLRLAPEGNRALATYYDTGNAYFLSGEIAEMADGTWAPIASLPQTHNNALWVSPPTRGPGERRTVMAGQDGATTTLVELRDAGDGTWLVYDTDMVASLGTWLRYPALSEDGLRIVGIVGPDLVYSSRPDLAHSFAPAVPVQTPPQLSYPYIYPDCGRLYFMSFYTGLYAQQ